MADAKKAKEGQAIVLDVTRRPSVVQVFDRTVQGLKSLLDNLAESARLPLYERAKARAGAAAAANGPTDGQIHQWEEICRISIALGIAARLLTANEIGGDAEKVMASLDGAAKSVAAAAKAMGWKTTVSDLGLDARNFVAFASALHERDPELASEKMAAFLEGIGAEELTSNDFDAKEFFVGLRDAILAHRESAGRSGARASAARAAGLKFPDRVVLLDPPLLGFDGR